MIAIRDQRLFRRLICVVEQAAHFAIDLFGGRFAVIAVARQFAAEENVIFVFAVLDHAEFFAHAPFANHFPRHGGGHLDVAGGAVGDIAKNNFLGDTAAHFDGQTGEQFILAVGIFVFFRQPHGRSKRGAARDDGDFVERLGVRQKLEQERVTCFVIRSVLFFFFAEGETAALLAPADFVARFFQFGEGDSL